jgi:hypothetical protein
MRRDTKPDNRIRRTSPHPAPTRFEELLADVPTGISALIRALVISGCGREDEYIVGGAAVCARR